MELFKLFIGILSLVLYKLSIMQFSWHR